jgi:hypothetical protein
LKKYYLEDTEIIFEKKGYINRWEKIKNIINEKNRIEIYLKEDNKDDICYINIINEYKDEIQVNSIHILYMNTLIKCKKEGNKYNANISEASNCDIIITLYDMNCGFERYIIIENHMLFNTVAILKIYFNLFHNLNDLITFKI